MDQTLISKSSLQGNDVKHSHVKRAVSLKAKTTNCNCNDKPIEFIQSQITGLYETTVIIDEPGNYYLNNNVIFSPTTTGMVSIIVDSDMVSIDLCGFSLKQGNTLEGTIGILVNTGNPNVTIKNGNIGSFTRIALYVQGGNSNITIDNLTFTENSKGGNYTLINNSFAPELKSVVILGDLESAGFPFFPPFNGYLTNLKVTNITFTDNKGYNMMLLGDGNDYYVKNIVISNNYEDRQSLPGFPIAFYGINCRDQKSEVSTLPLSNVFLKNIDITYNNISSSDGSAGLQCIQMNGSKIRIKNINISKNIVHPQLGGTGTLYGIRSVMPSNISTKNLKFSNNSSGNNILGVAFQNLTSISTTSHFDIRNSCFINNQTYNVTPGISTNLIMVALGPGASPGTIENCKFMDNNPPLVKLDFSKRSRCVSINDNNVVINNSYFVRNGVEKHIISRSRAIVALNSNNGITVTNSTFDKNTESIRITGCNNVVIQNNCIKNSTIEGIFFSDVGPNCEISENTLINNGNIDINMHITDFVNISKNVFDTTHFGFVDGRSTSTNYITNNKSINQDGLGYVFTYPSGVPVTTRKCNPRRCNPRKCNPRRCNPRRCNSRKCNSRKCRCNPKKCNPRRCNPRRCNPRKCNPGCDNIHNCDNCDNVQIICDCDEITPIFGYNILNVLPHDSDIFTQGLVIDDGDWFQSTLGTLSLPSIVMRTNSTTGNILSRSVPLNDADTEGIDIVNGKVYQLTYFAQTCFVYNKADFFPDGNFAVPIDSFSYEGEGWGLTNDSERFIRSDGEAGTLSFHDLVDFSLLGSVPVTDQGKQIYGINELEYINGEVWANIWPTNMVAIIDPLTGFVLRYINFSGLMTVAESNDTNVLNGIGYDSDTGKIYVTGKLWPLLFEVTEGLKLKCGIPDAPLIPSRPVSSSLLKSTKNTRLLPGCFMDEILVELDKMYRISSYDDYM